MKSIIVITDFSDSVTNELNYACEFAKDRDIKILLAYVYKVPASYAGEGISSEAINDLIDLDKKELEEELQQARKIYPQVIIETKMIIGNFLESLQELEWEFNPEMIIMGTIGEYSEFLIWNDFWIDALITLSSPVLVIPQHTIYNHIKNVAFACDYKKKCSNKQVATIERLVVLSGANFHIVHVTPEVDLQEENKRADPLKEAFKNLKPQYHVVENNKVVKGLNEFMKQNKIDLLLVIPHKHDFWYKLFHKSYTRQLIELDQIPVLSIHENT